MYGRSFEDPDGHIWEVMWMDVRPISAAPAVLRSKLVATENLPMSKISPCLWFDGEAEEAAKFYVSLLPDSRIEKVQKNTSTARPARPARCWWWSSRWPASASWR